MLSFVGDSLSLIRKIPFGSVSANRLDIYNTGQALVADIDNDDSLEIVVNHYGDGNIWAFELDGTVCNRFPIKTKGRPMLGGGGAACEITDLEGDGMLDLVTMDQGGYIYSWSLDSGSIYKQPWPSANQNAWNTSFSGYRPATQVAQVYESWDTQKANPYKWLETGTYNTIKEQNDNKFTRQNGTLRLEPGTYRNYHLVGPAMANLKNYTITGSFKVEASTSTFGINFYSQWPTQSRKYSLVLCSDDTMRVYYYPDSIDANKQLVDKNTTKTDGINTWYNFKIFVLHTGTNAWINVKVWAATTVEPTNYTITASVSNMLNSGTIGFTTGPSSGYSYIGPLTVKTNNTIPGAYIAYEDFKQDSLVDVASYLPNNWHADYTSKLLDKTIDTTGFTLDRTGGSNSLVYRHKKGASYPVFCDLIPYTTLDWENYEIRGTFEKPTSSLYDSIGVGIAFYKDDKNHYYSLQSAGLMSAPLYNKMVFKSTFVDAFNTKKDSTLAISNFTFSGDTNEINFAIRVTTGDLLL